MFFASEPLAKPTRSMRIFDKADFCKTSYKAIQLSEPVEYYLMIDFDFCQPEMKGEL